MAGLPDEVYHHKLVIIPGDYQLNGPVELLAGIGEKRAERLRALNIRTIRDFLDFTGEFPEKRLDHIRSAALEKYRPKPGSGTE
jgi:hypothetical protein